MFKGDCLPNFRVMVALPVLIDASALRDRTMVSGEGHVDIEIENDRFHWRVMDIAQRLSIGLDLNNHR